MITDKEGKCLTSTLNRTETYDKTACIQQFTDKAKVLIRKLLNEELSFIRIKGVTNEIVITFDDEMEIITMQDDSTKE
jgi:hypothetical protein